MKGQRTNSVWDVDPISSLIQKVHYRRVRKGLRSVSIVSEKRAEGKTTVAMLVARGLAEVYRNKVLLVDLNPEGDPLLNEYLNDYKSKDGFVVGHPFKFDIFRLKNLDMKWLKTAFDGIYTNQLIASLTAHYDVMIVDTMSYDQYQQYPLKINTHTNIVVGSKESFKNSKFKQALEHDKKDVLGVVFNK